MFTLSQAATTALGRMGRVRPARRMPHCTGAPVRRDSMEAGTFEDLFFAVPSKGEPDRMLRTARAALDAGRRLRRAARVEARELSVSERALTSLTAGAVRVFEELCTLARLNAGRVFPSYDWLAEATALGRATVARALAVLEATGFLVRQRRFKRLEGERHRYAQTSNAYRLVLPQRVVNLLPRWLRPAPLPTDAIQRTADRADEIATMEATLSARELGAMATTGALGRMLARLGAAIDRVECESHKEAETLHDSITPKGNGILIASERANLRLRI